MASANVMPWILDNIAHVSGKCLEIGSRRYKEHAFLGLRDGLLPSKPDLDLTGCDMQDGENVNVVIDLCLPWADVDAAFGGQRFDTMFCISTLEHITDIFTASRNIAALGSPGSSLFVSVPFVFRYHGYPGDLWRFTPEAVRYLFPDYEFPEGPGCVVTTLEEEDNRMLLLSENPSTINKFLFRPKSRDDKIERKRLKAEGKPSPYSLAPAMINMLGFKKKA
ncbi:MAG: hypothetical protein AB7G06_09795 [Bdellovibrionales bacterium]